MNKVMAHRRIVDLVGDFTNHRLTTVELYTDIWDVLKDMIAHYAEHTDDDNTNYIELEEI